MTLNILSPGIQTIVQAAPRLGLRHQGVPASGPADVVSSALLNRVVGNNWDAPLLEIPLGGFTASIMGPATIAFGGATSEFKVHGMAVAPWTPVNIGCGARLLSVGSVKQGARIYLAVSGGLSAQSFLGSASTYLPASFGGFEGRALREGDELATGVTPCPFDAISVPETLYPDIRAEWTLATTPSAETSWLSPETRQRLFGGNFTASRQSSRVGVGLEGSSLDLASKRLDQSVPVFPGTIQCPPSGNPFVLCADAQTTGGYPRVAQVIRADRHKIGQIRPGDTVKLKEVTHQQAVETLRTKKAALAAFLGSDFAL